MSKRGGRPKLPPKYRRDQRVVAYLTRAEMKQLKTYSETYGVSVSDLARRAITKVRIPLPVSAENMTKWREVGRLGRNMNQSARALNMIVYRLRELDALDTSPTSILNEMDLEKLQETAAQAQASIREISELFTDIRTLLLNQWEGNVAAAQSIGESGQAN